MTQYEYLQTIVSRFPSLMGLAFDVFSNKVKVIITDGKGHTILSKEMTVEGVFENEPQVEDIKNQCAFDLVCHLCLLSHGNIKNELIHSKEKQKTSLN